MRNKEDFARHKAYKLYKELFKVEAHYSDVHRTNFFRSYFPTKAKNSSTGWAKRSKERMYIVDRWRSVSHDGINFFESLREQDYPTVKHNS